MLPPAELTTPSASRSALRAPPFAALVIVIAGTTRSSSGSNRRAGPRALPDAFAPWERVGTEERLANQRVRRFMANTEQGGCRSVRTDWK